MPWMAGRVIDSVIIMEPGGIEGNWTEGPGSEFCSWEPYPYPSYLPVLTV